MFFLTGFHRTGTSAIYYDLCSHTKDLHFIPPARPIADLLKFLHDNPNVNKIFYPEHSSCAHNFSETLSGFIRDVYGSCDRFFKSTDFMDYSDYILKHIKGSKFIVVVRDPFPTILSLFRAEIGGGITELFNSDFFEVALKEYCSSYNSLMRSEYSERILWVKYENYCSEPYLYRKKTFDFSDGLIANMSQPDELEGFYHCYSAYVDVVRSDDYWSRYATEFTGNKIVPLECKYANHELRERLLQRTADIVLPRIDIRFIEEGLIKV